MPFKESLCSVCFKKNILGNPTRELMAGDEMSQGTHVGHSLQGTPIGLFVSRNMSGVILARDNFSVIDQQNLQGIPCKPNILTPLAPKIWHYFGSSGSLLEQAGHYKSNLIEEIEAPV